MINIQKDTSLSSSQTGSYYAQVLSDIVCDAHSICDRRSDEANNFIKIEISDNVYNFVVTMIKIAGVKEEYFRETLYVPFDFKQTYEFELNRLYDKFMQSVVIAGG